MRLLTVPFVALPKVAASTAGTGSTRLRKLQQEGARAATLLSRSQFSTSTRTTTVATTALTSLSTRNAMRVLLSRSQPSSTMAPFLCSSYSTLPVKKCPHLWRNKNHAMAGTAPEGLINHRAFSSTANDNDSETRRTGQDNSGSTMHTTILEAVKPMERFRLYRYLQLQTFSKEELADVFDRITVDNDDNNNASNNSSILATDKDTVVIREQHVTNFLLQRIQEIEKEEQKSSASHDNLTATTDDNKYASERFRYAQHEARRLMQVFDTDTTSPNTTVTKDHFVQTITDQAIAVDYKKMAPITLSILLVGTSVGIVTPAMPFVVSALELTPGQYGTVVSAFALAKMAGNIPSAIFVERHGRKVSKAIETKTVWMLLGMIMAHVDANSHYSYLICILMNTYMCLLTALLDMVSCRDSIGCRWNWCCCDL